MKTFITKSAPWMGYVLAVVSILYALIAGGVTTQTFPGKNGAEYQVKIDMPTGVLDLIDKCSDMEKVGAECPVSISATVTTTKAPTKVEVKPEPVKKVEEKVVPKKEVVEETKPVPAKEEVIDKKVDVKAPVQPKKVPEKKDL